MVIGEVELQMQTNLLIFDTLNISLFLCWYSCLCDVVCWWNI